VTNITEVEIGKRSPMTLKPKKNQINEFCKLLDCNNLHNKKTQKSKEKKKEAEKKKDTRGKNNENVNKINILKIP
jgi:hypothetical protein